MREGHFRSKKQHGQSQEEEKRAIFGKESSVPGYGVGTQRAKEKK